MQRVIGAKNQACWIHELLVHFNKKIKTTL